MVPAQAVGNAAVQAGGPSDGGSAEMARLRESAQAVQTTEENGNAPPPVAVETAKAVQPTPVSAKAVKVDVDPDRAAKDGVIEYPITGPDKFARTIAEAKQQAYVEEQRDAAGEAMDKATGIREDRDERVAAAASIKAHEARQNEAEEFAERPPAVSGAGQSAVAAADAALKEEMAAEAVDEALDAAAEARREANS